MLNQCQFIGNLGRDPEVRSFNNGGKVCTLNLAVTEKWRDKQSGERKEKTEWVRVAIYSDGLIGICEQYLRKGSKIFVQGKMETRKYTDQAGVEKYATEVAVRGFGGTITMLDSAGGNRDSGDSSGGGYDQSSGGGGGFGGGFSGGAGDLDDEVPFNMEWR